jgi:HAD superfamily hydrolase (TIGR01509 family)
MSVHTALGVHGEAPMCTARRRRTAAAAGGDVCRRDRARGDRAVDAADPRDQRPTTFRPYRGPVAGHCVVFDMDGVLVDSEPLWARARQDLVRAAGGRWLPEAETAMMGISSDRWSAYMHDRLRLGHLAPPRIRAEVISRMLALYHEWVPLLPGARAAVEAAAARWPLAVASGSDRVLLDAVLAGSGLGTYFAATVAGDEVREGKPAPMIYGEACRRLGAAPGDCLAVEDSGAGIESALAAGMKVVAVPRPGFEPDPDVLAAATVVLPDLTRLGPDLVAGLLAA